MLTPDLTEPEAVTILKVSRFTLLRARQAGKLPFLRHGRAVRYAVEDIENYRKAIRRGGEQGMAR